MALPKEGELWAPVEVYKHRLATSASIQLGNHATSAMSFVLPQDEPHRIPWIEIVEFICIYDLEHVCLICGHARILRLFNQSAREMASEALASETPACLAANQ